MRRDAGLSATTALGATGVLASASAAHAAGDGFGLRIVDRGESDARMRYYRFATDAIGWNPGVNVLLPDGYHAGGRRYPVLYLFHGGGTGQDFITFDRMGIRA
ncbi:esterase, partial [Streptomyces sp. NRRL WC-3753]